MKKYIILLFISGIFFSHVAFAAGLLGPGSGGSLTPGLWVPSTASGTITPNPSNLQIPCANIVGGCASSGASTSTTNTFSVPQNFNGVANTGTVSSTNFVGSTPTSTSYIPNVQQIFYFPAPSAFLQASGVVCGNTTGVSDVADCLQDYYSYGSTLSSSTKVIVGCYIYPSSTITSALANFSTNNERMEIDMCSGGGTKFNLANVNPTNNATTSWLTFNFGPTSGPNQQQTKVLEDGTIVGTNTSTTNPLVAVTMGGSNGCAQCIIDGTDITGVGLAAIASGSVYDFQINNTTWRNNGHNFLMNPYNNSGESDSANNDWWTDQANGTSSNCIYVQAAESYAEVGGSNDNCHLNTGAGVLNIAESHVTHEDTAWAANGGGSSVTINSGNYSDVQSTFMNDSQSVASGTTPIELSGTANANLNGTVFAHISGATTTASAVIEDVGYTGCLTVQGLQNGGAGNAAGVVAIIQGDTVSNNYQFGGNCARGYSWGIYGNGSNLTTIANGNQSVGTFNNSGSWTFPSVNATTGYSANGVAGTALGACGSGLSVVSSTVSEGITTVGNCDNYLTAWEPAESSNSITNNGGLVTTSSVRLYGPFAMQHAVEANSIMFGIQTADASATDLYDLAIYSIPSISSTVATKVFDTGALAATSTNTSRNVSSTQGTVFFPPGDYLVGISGNSTTAKFYEGSAFYQLLTGGTGSTVSNGLAPATTTFTISVGNSAMPSFMLHM